jgi:hypothetical protein
MPCYGIVIKKSPDSYDFIDTMVHSVAYLNEEDSLSESVFIDNKDNVTDEQGCSGAYRKIYSNESGQ